MVEPPHEVVRANRGADVSFSPAPRGTNTQLPYRPPSRALEAEARITWVAKARCRGADPDELFVRGAAQRKAAVICRHCPVIAECGADALDNRVEFGVWGGMTERQRRALLKQHPRLWAGQNSSPRSANTARSANRACQADFAPAWVILIRDCLQRLHVGDIERQ